MEIRLIGAMLVIVSSSAIGLYLSSMVKGRIEDLKEMKKNMMVLRGEIRYGSTPLPEAIAILARRNEGYCKDFLQAVSDRLNQLDGTCFYDIWDDAILYHMNGSYMTKLDKEQLRRMGENLGYLDKEMQMKTIDLYVEQLETEINEALATKKDKVRVYNMLGVLFGIFITVVLI